MATQPDTPTTSEAIALQTVEVHMSRKVAGLIWGALLALMKAPFATYATRRVASRLLQPFSELRRGTALFANIEWPDNEDGELSDTVIQRWLAQPEHRGAKFTLSVASPGTNGKSLNGGPPIVVVENTAHSLHEACKGRPYAFGDDITRILYDSPIGTRLIFHAPHAGERNMVLVFTVEDAK